MNNKQYKTIEIEMIKNKEGEPTCRASKNEVCVFLECNTFGFSGNCFYDGQKVYYEDNNYLAPSKTCPIWNK